MLRNIGSPMAGLIIATGRTDVNFYWNIGMLIIFPISVYFGSKYSLSGTATALSLITILSYLPAWKFLYKKLIDASLKEYMMQLVPNLLFSMITSIIVYSILKSFEYSDILSIIVGFFLFVSIYIVITVIFDREMIAYIYKYFCRGINPKRCSQR
jgi:O-antigen/teichoic acid export membrane protein